MQVVVSDQFESLVYHISTNLETMEVWFLIWDPKNKKFDLVDADACRPVQVSAQSYEVNKSLSAQAAHTREARAANEQLAKLRRADEREAQRNKEKEQ